MPDYGVRLGTLTFELYRTARDGVLKLEVCHEWESLQSEVTRADLHKLSDWVTNVLKREEGAKV